MTSALIYPNTISKEGNRGAYSYKYSGDLGLAIRKEKDLPTLSWRNKREILFSIVSGETLGFGTPIYQVPTEDSQGYLITRYMDVEGVTLLHHTDTKNLRLPGEFGIEKLIEEHPEAYEWIRHTYPFLFSSYIDNDMGTTVLKLSGPGLGRVFEYPNWELHVLCRISHSGEAFRETRDNIPPLAAWNMGNMNFLSVLQGVKGVKGFIECRSYNGNQHYSSYTSLWYQKAISALDGTSLGEELSGVSSMREFEQYMYDKGYSFRVIDLLKPRMEKILFAAGKG